LTTATAVRHVPALILFGAPGSGKGTQARLLQERCMSGPHISTGEMLRRHIEAKDEIGREVQGMMRAGRLVPDQLVNTLVEARIQQDDCRNGFILDGYPRTVNQAKVLMGVISRYKLDPAVIHLMVDYEKLVARLSGRRQCPVCGTLYSLTTNPPKVAGICDLEGAALVTREDDRESVIRERLEQYRSETEPVLQYLRETGITMVEVEGALLPPDAISANICQQLQTRREQVSGGK
jgi:adenylate kinase